MSTVKHTPPTPARRGGARHLLPWETRVSRRAGLPTDRGEWLAIVLPVILAADSSPAVEAALAAAGHAIGRGEAQKWHRSLAAEHAAGRLPEAPQGLPVRVAARRFGTPEAPAVVPRKGRDVTAAATAASLAARREAAKAEARAVAAARRERKRRAKTAVL